MPAYLHCQVVLTQSVLSQCPPQFGVRNSGQVGCHSVVRAEYVSILFWDTIRSVQYSMNFPFSLIIMWLGLMLSGDRGVMF